MSDAQHPNERPQQSYAAALATGKDLPLTYHRRSLNLRSSQELFSSHQIDTGTRLLLKTVSELAVSGQVRKVLDLGCGYGPLGLALAAALPQRHVHLVDRDALAITFTRENARQNDLPNVRVYGSLGYDDVPDQDFDLILSNIPGKAGIPVITSLLLDARRHLQPGGITAVVVVPPLSDPAAEILNRPDVELLLREDGPEHTVFHYRFLDGDPALVPPQTAFARGLYDRGPMDVDYHDLHFSMLAVRGLPEFDKLSHQSELLLAGLEKLKNDKQEGRRAILFNPGQGHVPVALWQALAPRQIILVDRDLLSLRASARNLQANGCPPANITTTHQVDLSLENERAAGLIIGVLRDSEGPEANYALVRQAAQQLAPQGELLVAGGSTTITRLEKTIKKEKLLSVKQRKRNRAKRLLILKAR